MGALQVRLHRKCANCMVVGMAREGRYRKAVAMPLQLEIGRDMSKYLRPKTSGGEVGEFVTYLLPL
jgi:hypothetical protein